MAGGSVTDPEKRYHLELATPHRSVSREAYSLLLDMGFAPKETQRGGNCLLYFKQADAIADFFTTIGASRTAMAVMTAKVEKEMRNTITRQINCDNANTDKAVAAAQAQIGRHPAHRPGLRPGRACRSPAAPGRACCASPTPRPACSDLAQLSQEPP